MSLSSKLINTRISFLSPFYPYRGGIAQFSDSLYLALRKSSEIKAFTFTRQYPGLLFPGTSQYVSKNDINRGIDTERVLDSINPLTFAKTAKKMSEFDPGLVLISYWMPFFAYSLGGVAKRVRKMAGGETKIISIMHNVLPHEKRIGDKWLSLSYLKHIDGFVVLNDKSKHDLLSLKPDAKYIVLPHPLYDHYGERIERNAARMKLDVGADKKVMLFFGLVRDYKGLDLLLEALAELDNSYYLIVAGEVYGGFGKYSNIIEKHSLRDRVLLHSRYIPESEIALYFSASDVCVLPYRSGTQSGIEGVAYHFGLPVIVTDVGGLKETVETFKTGLVVPKPEISSLASVIRTYFEHPALISSFKSSIGDYKSKYSWNQFAERLLEFYLSLPQGR
jgi:glycosyltransferase involved in cell wall biosynthesis